MTLTAKSSNSIHFSAPTARETLLKKASLVSLLIFALTGAAEAGSTDLSAQISTEREPEQFSDVLNTIYKFKASHTFENGLILDGSFEVEDPADGDPDKENLEGNLGYRLEATDFLSLTASAGVGERFTSDNDFPYYVLRVGSDARISDQLNWNIATFRYRNAFDEANDYETPRLTTGLTFHVNDHNAIYGEIYRNFDEEWQATATGLTAGYTFSF